MPGSIAMPEWKNPYLQCARAAHIGYCVRSPASKSLFSSQESLTFPSSLQKPDSSHV